MSVTPMLVHVICCPIYLFCILFVGSFHIALQSPPKVYMREGETIPLYCVASNHTLLHTYRWESSSGELSVLSPVLWVNKIDTYKCTVTESANSREYHSSNICVQGLLWVVLIMVLFAMHSCCSVHNNTITLTFLSVRYRSVRY